MRLRSAVLALLCAWPALSPAGSFIFADEAFPDSITHPNGYTGNGGPRVQTVCLRTTVLPAGVTATQVENTLEKAIATWNAQRVSTANLGSGTSNDVPSGEYDFESALLHEFGHCLALGHPNHATESGLLDPEDNGTKSTDGANNVFNQSAGSDGLHGSADDLRGDDVSLYWYRDASNDPLAFPATIDSTTFRRTGGLPPAHNFARNGDRDVLNAMGVANTESVMQQGQFDDEAHRRLTAEDLSTLRLGAAGLDGFQGTSDDYTVSLDYIGRTQNCDITVEFNGAAGFAACGVTGVDINATHVRLTSAAMEFATDIDWFFSQSPNTTTTITADSPDPSAPGFNYTVTVAVAVDSPPSGPVTGTVEVRDDVGNLCTATLSSGNASCNLPGSASGTRTLQATYLGLRGFDSSTSATATHTVNNQSATLTLSDSPSSSVVGQSYTVSASVTGSFGTPTGTVVVNDGRGASCNITLASGTGNCSLTATAPGTLTLSGSYSGDGVYSSDTDTESHGVNRAATTTTIVSHDPTSTVVGQSYTVDVTLTVNAPGAGAPTGSVSISDGQGSNCTATLNAGAGSCVLTSTTAGNLVVTANYGGDTNFSPSNDTVSHPVGKASTSLSIVTDAPDPSTAGQGVPVTFSLSVLPPGAGTPTGNVAFTVDFGSESCTSILPSNTCTITLTQVGDRTLSASYSGNSNFNASTDVEAHQVLPSATIFANGFE